MTPPASRVEPLRPPYPCELQKVFDTIMPSGVPPLTLFTTLARVPRILLRNAAGEILVHRRTDTKDVFPSAYDVFSGGVCAAGESYDDCARREVAEEFGVVGADLRFLFKHRYRGPGGQAWGAVYEARWDDPVRPQESEVAWLAWVAPERLDRMFGELPFCPDSREIFERLRRIEPPRGQPSIQ